jgi:HAD superfamily hydrolase (TIGR01509 family)
MIKAVIFDMDGVISDTQKLHASVEEELLRRNGIMMSAKEITEKFSGVPTKYFFNELFRENKVSADIESVMEEKWKRMAIRARKSVSSIPGAIKLINELKRKKIKLGLASSSKKPYVEAVLSKLRIKEKFDAITTNEEVKRGKPFPDIFLLTAEKLHMIPAECAVIEDAVSGVIAANRAGMKSIAFVDKYRITESDRMRYPADFICNDLKKLNVKQITIL